MRLRCGLAALIMLVGTAGCAKEATNRTASEAATKLDVVATDFAFDGVPATFKGGRIDLTLRNDGEVPHELGLIDLSGRSIEDFSKVAAKFMEGGPIPDWMKSVAATPEVEAGETLTASMKVPAGDYVAFCALTAAPGDKEGPPHFVQGMRQDVSIVGDNGKDLTAADGEWLAHDYTFEAPKRLNAGRNSFVLRNASPEQWHFMQLEAYPVGVDAAEAEAAFDTLLNLKEGERPPADLPMGEPAYMSGIFSAGLGQTFDVTLEEGRTYLASCFIQDRTGGPPHAIGHKMYKAFTVPA